ncbi:hypothetical protein KR038_006431 [Drosophila bunnanda]|nr:hypothetical protein KR038_006431 [Drosophila bunnanda]
MHIPRRFLLLIVVLLALIASGESRRSGYRLPKIQGRSASDSPSPQDVGSGRDLMKKFMMMRGLFQQPSDNVIIITGPSTTSTTTTTPTPSTTTTTTTTTGNTTGRSFDDSAERQGAEPIAAMPTLTGLEDRLDLPEGEPLVVQETEPHKPKMQKRFRVKNLQLGSAKRSHGRKTQVRRHIHRHHKKNKRSQKKTPKSGKTPMPAVVNQQRNTEASTVNFIEPYHNDRPQRQTSQSGTDSRLQRIWRRFQIAN